MPSTSLMKQKLETEDLRQLPNSKWLQKLLKLDVEMKIETIQSYIKDGCSSDFDIEYNQECKTGLEILTQVLDQCGKSGKYVTLTKTQWDGLYRILDSIRRCGGHDFFDWQDPGYWNDTRPTIVFDIDMGWKNVHSLEKYLDLGLPLKRPSIKSDISYEQLMRCIDGACDCSEEEIINYPSVTPTPKISKAEWQKCDKMGFIGYEGKDDTLCPICGKSIYESDHGDHKVVLGSHRMMCFGCGEGVDPYLIRWQITLTSKQRQHLLYMLRDAMYAYEPFFENEEEVDESWKVYCKSKRGALELKLVKNARYVLRSSDSRVLLDPYTLAVLRGLCDRFLRNSRDRIEIDEEWGKMADVISEIREIIDNSINIMKPLCLQCVESKSG